MRSQPTEDKGTFQEHRIAGERPEVKSVNGLTCVSSKSGRTAGLSMPLKLSFSEIPWENIGALVSGRHVVRHFFVLV